MQNMPFLSRKISPASIGFLRIIIGLFVFMNLIDFHAYFKNSLVHSSFFFTYDFFDWIGMLSPENVNAFFALAYIACILLILGVFYRISAIVTFICYTYILLTDIGHYNNHFYLLSIFLLFLCIVNGNYWGGLTSKKHLGKQISSWQIALFRWQIVLVYVFGALSKFDRDWLNGYPMRYWLYNKSANAPGFLADFLKSEFAVYFFSWSGLVFDLFIGFLLLSRKTRRVALIPLLFFHLINHFLWQIGSFPWMMIAVTIVFFEPELPQQLWSKLKTSPLKFLSNVFTYLNPKRFWSWLFPKEYGTPAPIVMGSSPSKATIVFLVSWTFIQLFLPLRQYFFSGSTAWTGQGQLFAWRMMLIDEVSAIRITFEDPATKEFLNIDIAQYLNPSQIFRVGKSPRHLLKFVRFLAKELEEKGHIQHPVIHLEIYKSVNNRKPQLLNDTALNYAEVEQAPLASATWILPWSSTDELPTADPAQFEAWSRFLNNNPHQYIDD